MSAAVICVAVAAFTAAAVLGYVLVQLGAQAERRRHLRRRQLALALLEDAIARDERDDGCDDGHRGDAS